MIMSQPVCPSVICFLSNQLLKLKEKLKEDELDSESEDSDETSNTATVNFNFHAAKQLRSELKSDERDERKILNENIESDLVEKGYSSITDGDKSIITMNINYATAYKKVNSNLYNHIAWMVTDTDAEVGDDGRVILDSKCKEKVLNIVQDITAAVSGIATPKQVGMALHLLKETRSKTLVTLFNRFGNCIRYTDTQRYITSMADIVKKREDENGVFIPLSLKQNAFIQSANDNLDFPNLHATTHIFYQFHDVSPTDEFGFVPIAKPRSTSLEKIPLSSTSTNITDKVTLNDRRKARSLLNVAIVLEDDIQVSAYLDCINLLWHLTNLFPTVLFEGIDNMSS